MTTYRSNFHKLSFYKLLNFTLIIHPRFITLIQFTVILLYDKLENFGLKYQFTFKINMYVIYLMPLELIQDCLKYFML